MSTHEALNQNAPVTPDLPQLIAADPELCARVDGLLAETDRALHATIGDEQAKATADLPEVVVSPDPAQRGVAPRVGALTVRAAI